MEESRHTTLHLFDFATGGDSSGGKRRRKNIETISKAHHKKLYLSQQRLLPVPTTVSFERQMSSISMPKSEKRSIVVTFAVCGSLPLVLFRLVLSFKLWQMNVSKEIYFYWSRNVGKVSLDL